MEGKVSVFFILVCSSVCLIDLIYKKTKGKDFLDLKASHLSNAIYSFLFLCSLAYFFDYVVTALVSALAVAVASFGCYSIFKIYDSNKNDGQGGDTQTDKHNKV